MNHESYLSTKVFRSLDGIRAISITAVIWHHTLAGQEPPFTFLNRGYLGVDMFFVLSGFLIVTLLLRERSKTGIISLKNFYIRRTLRIFPLFYGILLFLAVLFLLKPASSGAVSFFKMLPHYLTYTSNWFPSYNMMAIAWSLSTEEQFYVVWPFIERFAGPTVSLPLLGGVILINQLVSFGIVDHFFGGWIGAQRATLEIMQVTFTPMCLGVLLAHLLHSEIGFRALRWLKNSCWSPILLISTLLLTNLMTGTAIGPLHRVMIQIGMTLLLASCVINEQNGLKPFLTNSVVVRIGKISYGLYLLHLIASGIVHPIQTKLGIDFPGAFFVFSFALSTLLAELSYRYYETPFLKLKYAFSSKL